MTTLTVCTRNKLSDEFRSRTGLALREAFGVIDPTAKTPDILFQDKDDIDDYLDPGHAPLPPFNPVQDKMTVSVPLEQESALLIGKSADLVQQIFNRLVQNQIVARERALVVVTGVDYSRGHYYYGGAQP